MDRVSASLRSENMRRIKSKDTVPELEVRAALRRLGVGYRLHVQHLPGKPDIVMAGRRLVLFVHGCFWHQHPGCRRAFRPAIRQEWWSRKLERNVAHDAAVVRQLEEAGWRVAVIWECETKNAEQLQVGLSTILLAELKG